MKAPQTCLNSMQGRKVRKVLTKIKKQKTLRSQRLCGKQKTKVNR